MEEVIIIGAGPCGLSAAIELKKRGIDALVIEKYNVVHSIYLYPTHMQFFSTPELLEIGGLPFTTPNEKPTRTEALYYYRGAAKQYGIRVLPYHEATQIAKIEDGFSVKLTDRFGAEVIHDANHVVIATGYFDHPNLLGIPGEELPKVTHYYQEPHPYAGMKTAIIGGNNSAIDAAMDLLRVGADVTVIYRGSQYSANIKPWVLPIFQSMVAKERIQMLFNSKVVRIDERSVTYESNGKQHTLDNDFVLALTGFRPDRRLLLEAGAVMSDDGTVPLFHPETMESTVPGLYIAGVAASGANANEIFIETGRQHGLWIAEHIVQRKNGRE